MARAPLKDVEAHWHKLIENFQTSSVGFYSSVEEALKARKIPGLNTSRVDWYEGGILSERREYLRVSGEQHSFDICAAPFGTGFFFSSWVTRRKARLVFLYLVGSALLAMFIWFVLQNGLTALVRNSYRTGMGMIIGPLALITGPIILVPLSFLAVLWLIAIAARRGNGEPEAAILAVPLLGWFYQSVFVPETYYRIDTMLMFQSAVHSAMMEVIDGVTTGKGLRSLSDDDRKPVFRKLM